VPVLTTDEPPVSAVMMPGRQVIGLRGQLRQRARHLDVPRAVHLDSRVDACNLVGALTQILRLQDQIRNRGEVLFEVRFVLDRVPPAALLVHVFPVLRRPPAVVGDHDRAGV
jgi:hypothetical protein